MITSFPTADEVSASAVHLSDRQVHNLVHVFKLLADDTRMRILLYLSRTREMHVRELCKRLNQSQPAVSHHLALLREARLIAMRREGRHNFYCLKPRRFEQVVKSFRTAVRTREEDVGANGHGLNLATL
jgi:ArsR family transcriptional regulator